MAEGPRSADPATVGLIGLVLPVGLTLTVVGPRLDYPPSLVAAAVTCCATGISAGRQAWRGLSPIMIPRMIPTLVRYGPFTAHAPRSSRRGRTTRASRDARGSPGEAGA